MANHVIQGNGPPTAAPPAQGAHYVDLDTGDTWLARGVSSVADWGDPVGTGGGLSFDGEIVTLSQVGFASVAAEQRVSITDNGFATTRDSGANPALVDTSTSPGSYNIAAAGRLIILF